VVILTNFYIGFRENWQTVEKPLFIPAGFTFSIWLIIYGLLLGFIIYQLMPSTYSNEYIEDIGLLFVLTSLLNVLWLLVWKQGLYFVGWIILLLYFVLLSLIYFSLDKDPKEEKDKWLIKIPFSTYFAWITVALIANTMVVLKYYEILNSRNEQWITVIVIGVTVGIAYWISSIYEDVVFILVVIWALIGIFIRHYDTQNMLSLAAAVGIIILIIQGNKYKSRRKP
jgi:hypothetical protein